MRYNFDVRTVGRYQLRMVRVSQGIDHVDPRKRPRRYALKRVVVTLDGNYVFSFPTMGKAARWCRAQG